MKKQKQMSPLQTDNDVDYFTKWEDAKKRLNKVQNATKEYKKRLNDYRKLRLLIQTNDESQPLQQHQLSSQSNDDDDNNNNNTLLSNTTNSLEEKKIDNSILEQNAFNTTITLNNKFNMVSDCSNNRHLRNLKILEKNNKIYKNSQPKSKTLSHINKLISNQKCDNKYIVETAFLYYWKQLLINDKHTNYSTPPSPRIDISIGCRNNTNIWNNKFVNEGLIPKLYDPLIDPICSQIKEIIKFLNNISNYKNNSMMPKMLSANKNTAFLLELNKFINNKINNDNNAQNIENKNIELTNNAIKLNNQIKILNSKDDKYRKIIKFYKLNEIELNRMLQK